MTRATRLIAGLILVGGLLGAEDFQLYFLGLGPISLHTTLTYEGKGEHLVATARNEMDEPIEHVKICVSATPKSCLFELWNTEVWKPGADLEWNVDATKKAPTLAHAASVMSISLPRDKAEMAKSPDSIFTWEIGKVIDTNRARYLASIWQSSSTSGSSSTSSSASLNASTLTTGPLSQTSGTVNGQSSGTFRSSTFGAATPIYKEYEEVAIETDQYVYLTVERPFFRWSKTAHLIVNGSVKCHPDGQKLVIIDADGFRHQAAITKQILKPAGPGQPPSETKSPPATQAGLKPMTNEDVLTLKSAGFGDDFIVTKIRASVPGFNLDIADLVKLKQAGLSDSVVAAMVQSAAAK